MSYLLALVAESDEDSTAAQLAAEAQRVAVGNNVDVVTLAESVIAWLAHSGSGPAPTVEGKPVAVITAGPGEVVNQNMADRLREAGADVVADGVSITGSWSDPATITRLGDTVVAVAAAG